LTQILFLTTHNLATNPRLVKELRLALSNNFAVTVVCFEFRNWSYDLNASLKKELRDAGAVLHIIEAGRNNPLSWLYSIACEKLCLFLSRFFPGNTHILAQAVSRRHVLLSAALHKVKQPALVVGHNHGAMAACLLAAKKFHCPAGFDMEDYHPGEGTDIKMQQLISRLMQQLLPGMEYVSFASDAIKKRVEEDLHGTGKNWITLMNYFPSAEFVPPLIKSNGDIIKLVWFSQNINSDRGLELIFPFLKKHSTVLELHLFGNLNKAFYGDTLKNYPNIIVHDPLSQSALHRALADYDVGLALEPGKDVNNGLAVSNKMLAYLQAGLYVIATDTTGQSFVLNQLPGHGFCFNANDKGVDTRLEKFLLDWPGLKDESMKRYEFFRDINWEHASGQLADAWSNAARDWQK
jgi:glycosyltransferase involved in cell wall biosynthesis